MPNILLRFIRNTKVKNLHIMEFMAAKKGPYTELSSSAK